VTRQVLAEAGDKVGKMAIENTSAAGSRLMDMIKSGSKGANKNVTQMADVWRNRSSKVISPL
jgi:hypothetical protein